MKHLRAFQSLLDKSKDLTGIDVSVTRGRKDDVVLIKAVIINILCRYYGSNTVETGKLFDFHHSTVIHHQKNHQTRYRYEPDYADLYDKLAKMVVMEEADRIDIDDLLEHVKCAYEV